MTEKPGILVDEDLARELMKGFFERFEEKRSKDYASNVPYACTLIGTLVPEALQEESFLSENKLYIFFEKPLEVFQVSSNEIIEFIETKEEWEDYDFCIFDETMEWCIGYTHNDDLIFVNNNIK